jgi:hypothetical protein
MVKTKWPLPFESRTQIRLSNGQNKMADHLKAGPKKCPRDGHSKAGQSGFRMYTVTEFYDFANFSNQTWSTEHWKISVWYSNGWHHLKTRFCVQNSNGQNFPI